MEEAVPVGGVVLPPEGPSLWTALPGGLLVARRVAQCPVEAGEVAADAPVLPGHSATVDLDTPRPDHVRVHTRRRLIVLGLAGLWRVRTFLDPHETSVPPTDSGTPEAAVGVAHGHRIASEVDPVVQRRADGRVRLGPLGDPPVAGGVDDRRAPPLRRLGVVRLVPGVHVDPPDGAVLTEIQEVVVAHLVVVGGEAGVDLLEGAGRRVIDRDLPARPRYRVVRPERVLGRGAEVRLLVAVSQTRRHPHPALAVDGRAAHVGPARPDALAIVRRTGRGRVEPLHHHRRHRRHLHDRRPVRHRVQDGQRVGHLGHPVDRTVRVQRRIPDVAGRHIRARVDLRPPVPQRDDQIALDAGRPGRRRGRRLARGDTVAPVRQRLTHGTETGEHPGHARTRGPDTGPAGPDIERRPGAAPHRGQDLPRCPVPDLVAVVAGLHRQRELELRLRLGRRRDHIQPPRRRVHLCRGARVGSERGVKVELLARSGRLTRRVDQTVPAHEQVVASVRQIRHDIPTLVVGHDDASELRWQIGGLGDHPDPRLGTVRAGDDTADVVQVDRHVATLGAHPDE